MRHLQTKVGHLHTKGHGERYVGSLFRVDEPVPDDSRPDDSCRFLLKSARKVGFLPCSTKKNPKTLLTLIFYEYLCKLIYNMCTHALNESRTLML